MQRNFFGTIIGVACLVLLTVTTIVNVWQTNNAEKQQIELLLRIESIESALASGQYAGGGSGTHRPSGGIWGVEDPDYVTEALRDPTNQLSADPTPWLPDEATMGGTLNMAFGVDPSGFNFLVNGGTKVSEIGTYTHIGMASRHRNDVTLHAPELAYHWTISEDRTVHTLKLRDDFYWHEPAVDWSSGKYEWLRGEHRVTVHDVVFFLDMLMNPSVAGAAPLRSYFEDLESYRALDDRTLEVVFSKPKYMQKGMVAGLTPMPEFLYAFDETGERYDDEVLGKRVEDHWYNPNGLGAGPYRFVSFTPGVAIELERAPRYPLGGNAFDRIIVHIVKDQTQRPRKLITGELHIADLRAAQYRQEVLEGEPDSRFLNGELLGGEFMPYSYTYIGWNADTPYFSDRRVRQAMSHAFNAQLIIDDVYMGLAERCTGPMPTTQPFYNEEIEPYAFDLERAGALLDEAGWVDTDSDGIRDRNFEGSTIPFEFQFTIISTSAEYQTLANIFKEDLARIGIRMVVRPMEWSNLLKKLDSKEYHAVSLAWSSGPDVDFRQIWHSTQADIPKGSNRVGFRNAEADRIIEELEIEFDIDRRRDLAHEFHALLHEEQPYTFFRTPKYNVFWQNELENVWFQETRPYMNPRPFYLQDI